uniref:Uncharacterized protein n=1 Tax=Trichogramma kaykai TaxID=54128 RepID=A0ABD2VWR9_9HYME
MICGDSFSKCASIHIDQFSFTYFLFLYRPDSSSSADKRGQARKFNEIYSRFQKQGKVKITPESYLSQRRMND